jgi:two-component system cell cycle sensor histidine kinase/response regulator CckA
MIDSQVGAGTTFRALFPVSHGKMDEEKVRDDTPSQSVSGQPVILVVDDESEVRDLMRSTLERNGYSVLCAQNGREALDVFSHHASDVACVLLDLVMPEMGGEECLPQLRKISPDVKIVLMSGYSELEIKRRFTGQDISGLLPKPFLGKELLEVLERVLPVG